MKTWFVHRWARICALFSLVATTLANVPYDHGQISTIVPPRWKVPALIGGLILFGIFQLIQSGKPKPLPEQIIHIHHYYEKQIPDDPIPSLPR